MHGVSQPQLFARAPQTCTVHADKSRSAVTSSPQLNPSDPDAISSSPSSAILAGPWSKPKQTNRDDNARCRPVGSRSDGPEWIARVSSLRAGAADGSARARALARAVVDPSIPPTYIADDGHCTILFFYVPVSETMDPSIYMQTAGRASGFRTLRRRQHGQRSRQNVLRNTSTWADDGHRMKKGIMRFLLTMVFDGRSGVLAS
jgi:hypothetical protein